MSTGPFYEPGFYLCNVDSHAFQESRNGNPMIVFKVTPEARLYTAFDAAGEPTESQVPLAKSYQRTSRIVINSESEASMDFALMKLREAGFEGTRFADLDLVNCRVRMECSHEPGVGQYVGSTFERWEFPLPPRESVPLENDDKVARRLDNLFGKKLKTAGAEKPKATPKAAPEEKPDTKGENLRDLAPSETSKLGKPIDDSDIPF